MNREMTQTLNTRRGRDRSARAPGDLVDGVRAVKAILALAWLVGAGFMPGVAHACVPAADFQVRHEYYEDQSLLRATVLYRGVIENVRQDASGETILDIRLTRTFWGRGAPRLIHITTEYFAQCARGNLHWAVQETDSPSRIWPEGWPRPPRVRNGLGVTVLGRPEDAGMPSNFTILVDHSEDTQRVLARFRELKRVQ